MKRSRSVSLVFVTVLFCIVSAVAVFAQQKLTPVETRAIAREAYIYANPMVDGYRIQYAYFVDQ